MFYLNVVGYKGHAQKPHSRKSKWFYLNVVGYKGQTVQRWQLGTVQCFI